MGVLAWFCIVCYVVGYPLATLLWVRSALLRAVPFTQPLPHPRQQKQKQQQASSMLPNSSHGEGASALPPIHAHGASISGQQIGTHPSPFSPIVAHTPHAPQRLQQLLERQHRDPLSQQLILQQHQRQQHPPLQQKGPPSPSSSIPHGAASSSPVASTLQPQHYHFRSHSNAVGHGKAGDVRGDGGAPASPFSTLSPLPRLPSPRPPVLTPRGSTINPLAGRQHGGRMMHDGPSPLRDNNSGVTLSGGVHAGILPGSQNRGGGWGGGGGSAAGRGRSVVGGGGGRGGGVLSGASPRGGGSQSSPPTGRSGCSLAAMVSYFSRRSSGGPRTTSRGHSSSKDTVSSPTLSPRSSAAAAWRARVDSSIAVQGDQRLTAWTQADYLASRFYGENGEGVILCLEPFRLCDAIDKGYGDASSCNA